MARRRIEWLAAWQLEERQDHFSPARMRHEIATLQAELLQVLAALHGIRDVTKEAP